MVPVKRSRVLLHVWGLADILVVYSCSLNGIRGPAYFYTCDFRHSEARIQGNVQLVLCIKVGLCFLFWQNGLCLLIASYHKQDSEKVA